MDVEYKGQHAIIFFKDVKTGYIKRNSWIDFHMIPATRPYVALGTPNYAAIPIPGTSKRMDITDYRPGGLTFGARTGTWEFYIDHNKWSEWDSAYNTIKYYIHGNNFLVNLTDDPYVLYQGVLTISGYVAGQNYSKITIQYDLMSETILLDEPIDFGDFGRLPDPKYVDTDGDGQPDAIDTDGDGNPDVELLHQKKMETCDGRVLYLPLDQNDWPSRFVYTIVSENEKYIKGIDLDGDGTMDFKAEIDSNGKFGFDYDCDGEVDRELDSSPPPDKVEDETPTAEEDDDYDYYDVNCDGLNLIKVPKDPSKRPKWKYIYDSNGVCIGLDIDGDNEPDYIAKTDSAGVYGIDTKCFGYNNIPLKGPSEEDPQDHQPDEELAEDVWGVDFDCDGIIDFEVDKKTNPPVYIYDEDTYELLGVDFDHDGKIDIYATKDDQGRQGIDYDCDGEWDTGPYTPPGRDDDDGSTPEPGQEDPEGGGETPVVIGAYYPLLFITNEGESSMYGFASINKSRNMLGVYDLYTIYESDKVTPGSSEGSSDDEIIIG